TSLPRRGPGGRGRERRRASCGAARPRASRRATSCARSARPRSARRRQRKSAVEEAAGIIRDLLAKGAMESEALQRELRRGGVPERDWRAAKIRLGVRSQTAGFAGGWVWALPEDGQDALYNSRPSIFGKTPPSPPPKPLNSSKKDEDGEDGRIGEAVRLLPES